MERGAARLIHDTIGDSDSVDGLLAGAMDESDDEMSVGSCKGEDGVVGGLTKEDLQFLASGGEQQALGGRRRSISSILPSSSGSSEDVAGVDSSTASTSDKQQRKLVDEIGRQLLSAKGNPEMEQMILRQSLNLSSRLSEVEMEEKVSPSKDGPVKERRVLERMHESTRALRASVMTASLRGSRASMGLTKFPEMEEGEEKIKEISPLLRQVTTMVALTLFVIFLLWMALILGTIAVGPPRTPIGEYKIIEAQVGEAFFQYYDFYSGRDSAGSNGYNMYVSEEVAQKEGIVQVVTEVVEKEKMIEVYDDEVNLVDAEWLMEDLAFLDQLKREKEVAEMEDAREQKEAAERKKRAKRNATAATSNSINTTVSDEDKATKQSSDTKMAASKKKEVPSRHRRRLQNESSSSDTPPRLEPFNPDAPITNATGSGADPTETFVILSSSPTKEGPRNSIRIEGRRRFNRGLFIIDLRHMPAGCGTWPAFWLTDEANWPVNGEIDIVEGVNYQDTAKTALHTTKECRMDDVPEGSKTGTWDTAVGIPDKKTGIPDMTFRFAQDCFVYDPHQWINQGCVASDLKLEGRSLGVPLNGNGGGVYALEWDPSNRHIRTWVFSPHGRVPKNLRDAMRTATNVDESTRVAPDTTRWGLPYGHFPIGDGTNCPSEHFRNMRLVINLAFCGSVAGTRYFMDCPKQFKKFKTCEKWVNSDPDELKEAYWKIRGVYVYEREWQRQWT